MNIHIVSESLRAPQQNVNKFQHNSQRASRKIPTYLIMTSTSHDSEAPADNSEGADGGEAEIAQLKSPSPSPLNDTNTPMALRIIRENNSRELQLCPQPRCEFSCDSHKVLFQHYEGNGQTHQLWVIRKWKSHQFHQCPFCSKKKYIELKRLQAHQRLVHGANRWLVREGDDEDVKLEEELEDCSDG